MEQEARCLDIAHTYWESSFLFELTKFGDYEAEVRWTVRNFSRLMDEEVESEPFQVGGIRWRLIMFPRGNLKKEKKKAQYFALYLGIDDFEVLERRVEVRLVLSVVNQKYVNRCSGESQHVFAPGDEDSDWGFTQFMKLHELLNPSKGWLHDDALLIEANLKLLPPLPPLPHPPSPPSLWSKTMPVQELLEDLRRLRHAALFADLVLVLDGGRVRLPAHRAILAARCPQLARILLSAVPAPSSPSSSSSSSSPSSSASSSSSSSSSSVPWAVLASTDGTGPMAVEVRDVRGAVMEQVLEYLYTDRVTFDAERVLEVLVQARQLGLPRLEQMCEQLVQQHLSVENVLLLLPAADELHLTHIKELALRFVREHYCDVVLRSHQLQLISKRLPRLMVEIAQAPALLHPQPQYPPHAPRHRHSQPYPHPALAVSAAGGLPTQQGQGWASAQVEETRGWTAVSGSRFAADLGALFDSQQYSDVAFLVAGSGEGEEVVVRAHRCILAQRCDFFARMLQGGMLEAQRAPEEPLRLEGVPASALRLALRYLYTNEVRLHTHQLDEAFHLLDLAERFLLPRLKALCEGLLRRLLDVENVLEILRACAVYHLDDLKHQCLLLFLRHRDLLCCRENLVQLDHAVLVDLALLLARPDMQPERSPVLLERPA
jgi:hypothetical protein